MANYLPKIVYNNIEILFKKPPNGDFFPIKRKGIVKRNYSYSGHAQTSLSYVKNTVDLEFLLIDEDLKKEILDFYYAHGILGKSFNYFPHQDELAFYEVILEGNSLNFKKIAPLAHDRFSYQFNLSFYILP